MEVISVSVKSLSKTVRINSKKFSLVRIFKMTILYMYNAPEKKVIHIHLLNDFTKQAELLLATVSPCS